jgi:hypothetical protein
MRRTARKAGRSLSFVDLIGAYSKQADAMERVQRSLVLAAKSSTKRSSKAAARRHKVEQRLDEATVAELVDAYRSGATGAELALRYDLARSTVIGLVREHNAHVRYPRMTAREQAEVVRLYRTGVRQIDIAEQFGRHKSVIWHLLRRAGEL